MMTQDQNQSGGFNNGINRPGLVLAVTWFCISVFVGLTVAWVARERGIEQTRAEAIGNLEIHAAGVERLLDKYRLLTPLLIQDTDFARLLVRAGDRRVLAAARSALSRIAAMSGAEEIRLFDRHNRLLVSSQTLPSNILGLSKTSHLEDARQGRLGRATLVTFNGKSNYLFASALKNNGEILGLIDLRFSLETIEQNWALSINPVLAVATDSETRKPRVILTNRDRFHRLQLENWQSGQAFSAANGTFLAKKDQGGWVVADKGAKKDWLVSSRDIPLLEWQIVTLSDMAPIRQQAWLSGLLAAVILLLIGVITWTLRERAQRRRQILVAEQENARKLEAMVDARTEELRRAQADLIQAAKLAGLGQMSAAISHEFNQPLGAIRMFSENAELMIDGDKPDGAKGNLQRIRDIVDRMAELSKSLKTFARKPGTEAHPVQVGKAIQEVLTVLSPRLRKDGADIRLVAPDEQLQVMAGQVRLEQVLLNLLTNALDALADQRPGFVEISWYRAGRTGQVVIRDNGPGVPEDMMENLFDPFITSKGPGEGLGLGLSIAYNIMRDFNGDLKVGNAAEGGAVFTITLPLTEQDLDYDGS